MRKNCSMGTPADQKSATGKFASGSLVVAIAILAVFFAIIFSNSKVQSPPGKAEKTGEYILHEDALCGRELQDGAQLVLAMQRQDVNAAQGLLARGKVIQLGKGTVVLVIDQDASGLVYVRALTDYQTGERCWIAPMYLRR